MAFSSAALLVGKLVSMGVSIASVPLALGYLDAERYGLWLSLSTVIVILGFADLGIGNALRNRLSAAYGKGDRESARRDFASALMLLALVSAVLGIAFAIIYPHISWAKVFNVRSRLASAEAGPAMAIMVVCFLIGLPVGLAQTVRAAYQEAYINAVWTSAASVTALVGLVVALKLEASLPVLVLTHSGVSLLGIIGNFVLLVARARPWLRPRVRDLSWSCGSGIVRGSLIFFVLQLTVTIGFNIDNLVVAHLLGPETVVSYSLGARLFVLTGTLVSIVLGPLWPAYAEAITAGDLRWVRSALVRSVLAAGALTGLVAPILVGLGPWILRVWTRVELGVSRGLLVAFASWMMVAAVGNAAAMFLNACGIVRLQIATAGCLFVSMVALKIVLGGVFGMEGVAWAASIAYIPTTAVPTYFGIRAALRELAASGDRCEGGSVVSV